LTDLPALRRRGGPAHPHVPSGAPVGSWPSVVFSALSKGSVLTRFGRPKLSITETHLRRTR
jgi:hypothetical protein